MAQGEHKATPERKVMEQKLSAFKKTPRFRVLRAKYGPERAMQIARVVAGKQAGIIHSEVEQPSKSAAKKGAKAKRVWHTNKRGGRGNSGRGRGGAGRPEK